MVSSTSLTISGSSAEVGSSNSMIFGCMQSARAIATRCCWPPDSWAGYLSACSGMRTRAEIVPRDILGFLPRHLAHPDRRERAVLEHGQMRKKVELLKHHADFSAHLVDLLEVLGQFHAIDDDTAALPALDPVDASEQRRLAAAGWPANDDALAPHDGQIDVAQHVEGAEPLVRPTISTATSLRVVRMSAATAGAGSARGNRYDRPRP